MYETKQNTENTKNIQLISVKELAKVLSLSKRQIHRLNSCGKIPKPLRIGGSLRFVSSEISAWIMASCPDRRTWEAMKKTGGDYE